MPVVIPGVKTIIFFFLKMVMLQSKWTEMKSKIVYMYIEIVQLSMAFQHVKSHLTKGADARIQEVLSEGVQL